MSADVAQRLSGYGSYDVLRVDAATPGVHGEVDRLACELPVALEYNGISHATMLATPCDLEDFLVGFSFTEGIIRTASDVYDMEVVQQGHGVVIQARIASACLNDLKLRRRSLAGRSGCGLCGIESLDEVRRAIPALPPRPASVSARAVAAACDQLRARQPLHLATGATHAAAWADRQGNIIDVREDVGRHNALDKLIGFLLRAGRDTSDGLTVISSRASFEMVQKAAAAGMPALIAVSAPTTYAVDIAQELNVFLAGFSRDERYTVYSHPEYLEPQDSST